ncbi:MAG TPA: MASE1 domain-containing protein [Gemmataceae bacterium]|nr:MASE1 domain-containing protein [Gemmataceae bacterium]
MGPRPLRYVAAVLALAAVYFAAAKLGLRMALDVQEVSPVWPPTGIALAAILLFGFRVWPGIALGAFLANLTLGEPFGTVLGITAGNTLEALAGAWLLNRFVGFDRRMVRLVDAIGLVVLAAGVGCAIAATIGTISLCLGGLHPWGSFGSLWWVWWLGDATGALIVAPAILVWAAWPHRPMPSRSMAEAIALVAALVVVALVVFAAPAPRVTVNHPLEYAIFPFVVWAALRFGQRGTATVTLLASSIAIWGTLHLAGPFSRGTVHENLILLQTYMAAVAVTALLLGAALAERNLADRRRIIDLKVTHILADSATLAEATPQILEEICIELDWDVGEVWHLDRGAGVLRCIQIWHRPERAVPYFLPASQEMTFAPSQGLPGRVWSSGAPAWIPDVTADTNFPRARAAVKDGLRGGFAFPILLSGEVLGVIEFFSREVRPPDRRLLQLFAAVGSQVGQFIERKRAEDGLREASRRKDEFLAMLSHELRNPLAPIVNALHILKLPKTTPAQAEQVRKMMEGQVEHMVRLVDDLLDVSRIMRGRIELRKEPADLAQVIARAVETARPAIDAHHHDLAISLPPDAIYVEGDPVRLAQVFANLLNNAAKYTENAGHIGIIAAQDRDEAVVRVRDDGIGIPADVLPYVFELFVQGAGSTAWSTSGLGIGLTLVRKLVELHQGSVQAFSDGPGKGSEFVVRLPMAAARARTKERVEHHAPPSACASCKRVLVVDDNADAAESLAMWLRLQGHEVQTVHNGLSVLSAVNAFRPQALLLDLALPGKSGYQLAKELRSDPRWTKLVLAAVTGYGQDEDRRRSRESGFDYHLVKPVEPAQMQQVLADARLSAGPEAGQAPDSSSPSEVRRA